MSVGWESLPLVPLRRVLQHLSDEDAIAAMSVCNHWRTSILIYEGHREMLLLKTKQTERNLFLAHLFRKNVQKLHIYVDCSGAELDRFFNIVLPEFFDAVKLKELLFIGPSYLQQNHNLPLAKLRRVVTESLIFKNSHCMKKLGILGCDIDFANENDRYTHDQLEYYSAPLTFATRGPHDRLFSTLNMTHMVFSTLQYIALDYDIISNETLETLSSLPMFNHLALTIGNKRKQALQPLDWTILNLMFPVGLDVSLDIIAIQHRKFNEIIENVIVEGMNLVSLKVLFCKTMYYPLLNHVVRHHKTTLRELVWADCPYDGVEPYDRIVDSDNEPAMDACYVNPFVLICWQCQNLRRLVIHGYWIWQYDVLGFVRLRKTLQQLEISAIYDKHSHFSNDMEMNPNSAIRVLSVDAPLTVDNHFVQQVNENTEFVWSPIVWSSLDRGLQPGAAAAHTAQYLLREIRHPPAARLMLD